MSTFNENNGIYGYQQSKTKKQKDMLGLNHDAYSQTKENENLDDIKMGMRHNAMVWDNHIKNLNSRDLSDVKQNLLDRQKNFLVPQDSEERRRRLFVTSPAVVDEAINGYYEQTFKPRLAEERKKADDKAFDDYSKYATVPGADPFTALGKMKSTSDPIAALDRTISNDDGSLDKIAQRYAAYAGLDPSEYRRTVLEPALRSRAVNEFVDESMPRNTAEYIGRSAWRNSLMGGLVDLALQGHSKNSNWRYIDDAAMEKYNPSSAARLAGGVGGLFLDSGVFAGIGAAASKLTGAATNFIKNKAVTTLLSNGAANGLTRKTAEQIVKNGMVSSLSTKIAQSSTTQGLTLGAYDAAHSVVNDLLHGEQVDASSAASAFAKGAGTGVLLGAVGTPLKELSRGLTGGKKIAASTGVLSAESAVFTASTEIDKASQGIEIEPIDLLNDFGESAATLLAMRMLHWRPSGGEHKLNTVGRLRQEYRFSMAESKELSDAGVNPDAFIANLEKSLNVYQKNSGKAQESVREDYLKLMSNSGLSASTRAKLLYIVENKISSTPPAAVDYKVEKLGNGNYEFTTFDAEGLPIEKQICNGDEALRSAYFTKTGSLRRNRIANSEQLLMQNYDSQNFFRQAGLYARETGTDVDAISDAMYRKANKEPLTASEEQMMNDILQRSNYADSEVATMLHDIRRSLEQQYNLNEGSLLEAVDKSVFHCSPRENEALNAYEKAMENEVRALYGGTSKERMQELQSADSRYSGLGNDELKRQEHEDYVASTIEKGLRPNEGSIPTLSERYGIFANGIYKPEDWNSEYVWNTRRNRHRVEDIEQMGNEAMKQALKLGSEIELIFDESEISTRDPEYVNKVRSLGWYDEVRNKIVINLPNNMNISEVKSTVVHEIVGHKGFAELFGNYYYDFLEEVYARGSKEVREGIEQQAMRKGGSYHAGADEYLAILSERTHTTPEQRSIVRRFYDFVRDMLRRFNLYNSEISESELVSLIQRHHSAMSARKQGGSYRRKAFTPFETAWRTDGGYYNDIVARQRYDRYMQKNPELDGIASGFHDFKRHMYDVSADDMPQYRFRYIGEQGARNISDVEPKYLDKLDIAQKMVRMGFDYNMIADKTGWEVGLDGKWRMIIPNDVHNVEISDYVYRSLRLRDFKRAFDYSKIIAKSPQKRTKNEKQFIENIYKENLPYDENATLGDIMYEPVFFSAYPELADVPVKFVKAKDTPVLYHNWSNCLLVDKKVFDNPDKERLFLSAVQHIVQNIEGQRLLPMNKREITDDVREQYLDAQSMANKIKKMVSEGATKRDVDPLRWKLYKKHKVRFSEFSDIYNSLEDYAEKEAANYNGNYPPEQRVNIATYEDIEYDMKQGPLDVMRKKYEKYKKENSMYYDKPEQMTLREAERIRQFDDKWSYDRIYKKK